MALPAMIWTWVAGNLGLKGILAIVAVVGGLVGYTVIEHKLHTASKAKTELSVAVDDNKALLKGSQGIATAVDTNDQKTKVIELHTNTVLEKIHELPSDQTAASARVLAAIDGVSSDPTSNNQ